MPSSNAGSPEPSAAHPTSTANRPDLSPAPRANGPALSPAPTANKPALSPAPRTSKHASSPAPATPAAAACAWGECAAKFASLHQLATHLSAEHVMALDAGAGRACAWRGCAQQGVAVPSHRDLVAHLRTHTGGRSFLCPIDGCGKVYKRSDFLAKHISAHADADAGAAPAKRKAQPPADYSDTDSDISGDSDEHQHAASFNAGVPDSEAHADMLEAQLAYIRSQVAARQTHLHNYKNKIRRLRLENDILVDALAQM
ncbi:Zinc finger protein ZIC 2 [Coemansia sp. RSA 2618]|nr:Zinc finger protein ZIC 2 [Coemansia sp. RSA 2618]